MTRFVSHVCTAVLLVSFHLGVVLSAPLAANAQSPQLRGFGVPHKGLSLLRQPSRNDSNILFPRLPPTADAAIATASPFPHPSSPKKLSSAAAPFAFGTAPISGVATSTPSYFSSPNSAASAVSLAASAVELSMAPFPNTTAHATSVLTNGENATFHLSLVNNFQSEDIHAYILGLDSNGQVVFVTANSTFYYPASPRSSEPEPINADIAIRLPRRNQPLTLTIPGYISSARVWFVDGTLSFSVVDTELGPGVVTPTAANPQDSSYGLAWGFVELTFIETLGLFANLSYVDFVGLPLGMKLKSSDGVQTVLGVPANASVHLCDKLRTKAAEDGHPWDKLCVETSTTGSPRVMSPETMIQAIDSNAFATYWDRYITRIWEKYSTTSLMIDTQSRNGLVACTVSGDVMTCNGDNRPYPKPSSNDIFGCATGTFSVLESDNDIHLAVVPRLCAAFHRATLDLPGGEVQPSLSPRDYYAAHETNWYSAFVHQVEMEGKGYAFPYDDVTPSTRYNTAGVVSAPDPQLMTIFVGGTEAA